MRCNLDMVVCGIMIGVIFTRDVALTADIARHQVVVLGELLPMLHLIGRQCAAAVAEWALKLERLKYRLADEFRTIGHDAELFCQCAIHLKRNNFVFVVHHARE
jgi:hypothetical protein